MYHHQADVLRRSPKLPFSLLRPVICFPTEVAGEGLARTTTRKIILHDCGPSTLLGCVSLQHELGYRRETFIRKTELDPSTPIQKCHFVKMSVEIISHEDVFSALMADSIVLIDVRYQTQFFFTLKYCWQQSKQLNLFLGRRWKDSNRAGSLVPNTFRVS